MKKFNTSKISNNNLVVHTHEQTLKQDVIEYLTTINCNNFKDIINNYFSNYISYDFQIIILEEYILLVKAKSSFYEIIKITENTEKILKINKTEHKFKYIELSKDNNEVVYTDTENKNNIVLDYLNDISNNVINNTSLINYYSLIRDIRLIDRDNVKIISENDNIMLTIYDFRDINPTGMQMNIVLKETNQIVGSIEYTLNRYSIDNFKYEGNVCYEIYPEYQNQGYATQALNLLKVYIFTLEEIYNKVLFISTLPENIKSQKVAQKCGGELYYEGDVPKNSKVSIYGKVNKVIIYKINYKNNR